MLVDSQTLGDSWVKYPPSASQSTEKGPPSKGSHIPTDHKRLGVAPKCWSTFHTFLALFQLFQFVTEKDVKPTAWEAPIC